jgi:hypothetical protein
MLRRIISGGGLERKAKVYFGSRTTTVPEISQVQCSSEQTIGFDHQIYSVSTARSVTVLPLVKKAHHSQAPSSRIWVSRVLQDEMGEFLQNGI